MNYSLLPQDINTHLASFIADEIQATDPRCYRATRAIQAAWRAWRARASVCFVYTSHMCERCTSTIASDRVHTAQGGLTWTCDACWSAGDHLEWDWEQDDLEQRQGW